MPVIGAKDRPVMLKYYFPRGLEASGFVARFRILKADTGEIVADNLEPTKVIDDKIIELEYTPKEVGKFIVEILIGPLDPNTGKIENPVVDDFVELDVYQYDIDKVGEKVDEVLSTLGGHWL